MAEFVVQDPRPHEEQTENTTGTELNQTAGAPPEISKTQRKKLAKRQLYLERRKDQRKVEREKRKARKRELAQQREKNGEPTPVPKKKILMSESDNKFRVVIDMDFNDYMTEQEIAKAVKQLGRIYALNRHSDSPCQLYFSSLKGKIRDRFAITNAGYKSWDINISESDYTELFIDHEEPAKNSKDQIVYLTGDSEETLPAVDDLLKDNSKIFVIGGLVDHNRHKNLCLTRAKERNIKTAQIPIKNNVQLCQRHILSTVTVFELMLNVLGLRKQWPDALRASIPKRKIAPEDRGDEVTLVDGLEANDTRNKSTGDESQ